MQREGPLTPNSRRINRPARSTPDRLNNAASDLSQVPRARVRATMAPGDFAAPAPGLMANRRNPLARQSIMPRTGSQNALDTTRRPEAENKDLEMKLLYDKYLQTLMVELLMKQKAEEKERIMITQLGMLAKEEDALIDKLQSMKTKEKDLKHLIELQNELDTHFADITASLDTYQKEPAKILGQLISMLECLDTLRCKNIVIPETVEDMQKIDELFAKCSINLQSINDFIGNQRNSIFTVNRELKNFTKAHTDVQDYAKKVKEALSVLQSGVLKDAANTVQKPKIRF